MPNFLYRLPNFVIMILFMVLFILMMDFFPKVLQLIPFFAPSTESDKYAHMIFAPVCASTGLIIGFLLSQGQENLRQVENLVADEAGRINNLDRLLLRFGDEHALEIRALLIEYIRLTINKEWVELWHGKGCKETHMVWRSISQKIFQLDPKTPKQLSIYADIIEKSEEVAESRELRIDKSTVRLSNIFWVVIGLLVISLASINTLFFQPTELIFASAIVPTALGGLVSLLVVLDQPFKGESSVKPKALSKVLDSIMTRGR